MLVIDDSTLDKPYAHKMGLVTSHWSGKHGRVVLGINLISLLWTNGQARLPCDFRIYNKQGEIKYSNRDDEIDTITIADTCTQ